jgi:hypothetical protein
MRKHLHFRKVILDFTMIQARIDAIILTLWQAISSVFYLR